MTATAQLCGQSGIDRLIREAFGSTATVTDQADVAGGRGTFSSVMRLELEGPGTVPPSVVAKLPVDNLNRDAAATSGAYLREATAYEHLLPLSPVARPALHACVTADRTSAFLIEDLTPLRRVDQLDGLDSTDAAAVAEALGRFHKVWRRRIAIPDSIVERLAIRRSSVAGFSPEALARGLMAVSERWVEVTAEETGAFRRLLDNSPALVDAFSTATERDPTLCHGDPRADNLSFADDGSTVLFDWQQIAIQFGEADLAWLAATSLTADVRRACHNDLLCHGEGDADLFRLGMVLPGLAALLLAQREANHPRTQRFISTSLRRIATALADYDVATAA